jgi:hypothetical protein
VKRFAIVAAALSGCCDRPLAIPEPPAPPDLAMPDLLPMHCPASWSGARTGMLDGTQGCSVFVVDDDSRSIFSLDTFTPAGGPSVHALIEVPPEIVARHYALADLSFARVAFDDGAGNEWTAGVSQSGATTGDVGLRIDAVGARSLDARGRTLYLVSGAVLATLVDPADPTSESVIVDVNF